VQQAKSKKAKKLGYNKYTDCTSFQQKIETLIPRPTSMRALRRNAMEKNSGARRGRQAKASLVFEEKRAIVVEERRACVYIGRGRSKREQISQRSRVGELTRKIVVHTRLQRGRRTLPIK
jgi:hypothetical protein